jgi:hypothetical protein
MAPYLSPGISYDQSAWDPLRITAVRHELAGHPLLQLDSLIELAKRLDKVGGVRAHNDTAQPTTSFTNAPDTHPAALSTEETIRRIQDSKAWMALHNIQNDPLYRTLVDEVLDYVQPMIELKDPGMCHRAGWIFVTSPNAITPYHLDHEHNFILQILGKKTIYVFDPLDRSIVTEQALELFHAKRSRDLVVFSDEIQKKAQVFNVEPGMGAYMPVNAPHWVKNGDNVSITVSFTYYTKRTLRRKSVHRANFKLRKLGLSPRPVGERPLNDLVKRALSDGQRTAKLWLSRTKEDDPSLMTDKYAIGG